MPDHGTDEKLDRQLRRAFAAQAAPADDAAFLARVRAGVEGVERNQRWARAAALALLALCVVAATPWVVEFSLMLAQAALSPVGALCAVVTSLTASVLALRTMR